MAIFYMNVQIIGRSAGRTATGAAAYRAAERIVDERTGQVFDCTRRRGEIESHIFTPDGAPAWAQDRARLWNAVERAERRSDAQVAREIVVAFPKELSSEQQRELIVGYVHEQFVSRGMAADVAIHRNPGNPHVHIMLTMREMGPEGLSTKKNREWNKPELLENWRERWAAHANQALERAGQPERIDHRSLADQGSERMPQVHLGSHAAALERRGIRTEVGDQNRLVAEHNAVLVDLEKARQDRERQRVEQVVVKRHADRVNSGWLLPHSIALAELEYYHCDGRQLSWHDTARLSTEKGQQLSAVQKQIFAIRQDDHRLQEATKVLADRQKAAAEVKRLDAPLAVAKRWFSSDARREYQRAQDYYDRLDRSANRLGTSSESELKQQRAKWEEQRSQMPALEAQVAALSKFLDLTSRALDGFLREHDRERDYQERQRRKPDRDLDRGR